MTTTTMDNDGKVKFYKTKKAKSIPVLVITGIVVFLLWTVNTLTVSNDSLNASLQEATVIPDNYIIEDLNVVLCNKWYMPWTDQIVRFSGDKLKGTLCPTDKTFTYTLTQKELELTHAGKTSFDLTTLEPGSKIYFDGGGINGWIQLPNNKESEVANLHISVDLNFDLITEK